MKDITVVIPNKHGQNPSATIGSLYFQTYLGFDIIIVNDFDLNANKARNAGLRKVDTEFVLFSDNDIFWKKDAIEKMRQVLLEDRLVSYAYGAYEMDGNLHCNQPFNPVELRKRNFISTMSLVRTEDHPGFDENIKRLQDWDVWLTMLENGYHGKFTGGVVFSTPVRDGITKNGIPWNEAINAIKKKHHL
jgi:glycosyltransferase involved in cell wall biosynthesis